MIFTPYKDIQQVRMMRVVDSTTVYPTGVVLGHTNGVTAAGNKGPDTASATEADCVFLPADGTTTPYSDAFLHGVVQIAAPGGSDQQFRIDSPRKEGDGTITWDLGTAKLPTQSPGAGSRGMFYPLGIFIAGGFRLTETSAPTSDGEYYLIYELLPVKS